MKTIEKEEHVMTMKEIYGLAEEGVNLINAHKRLIMENTQLKSDLDICRERRQIYDNINTIISQREGDKDEVNIIKGEVIRCEINLHRLTKAYHEMIDKYPVSIHKWRHLALDNKRLEDEISKLKEENTIERNSKELCNSIAWLKRACGK